MQTITLNGKTFNLRDNAGEYGIENIKEIATEIGKVWKNIKKRLADGRLGIIEAIRTGIELSAVGAAVIGSLKELEQEITNLSQGEVQELIIHLSKELGLSEHKAGEFVRTILIETINIVYSSIRIYKSADEVF